MCMQIPTPKHALEIQISKVPFVNDKSIQENIFTWSLNQIQKLIRDKNYL